MSLRINTNTEALTVHNNLVSTNNKVAQSLKRLSSGLRINSAKDDASGLAVANNFAAKISSMTVASQNATEANSMLQTADGAYSKVNDILTRMRDLATQSASGQTEERDKLNTEYVALKNEIDRIASSTKYGNLTLTGASTTTYTFQVGAGTGSNDVLGVTFNGVTVSNLSLTADINSIANATAAMGTLDTALSSVNSYMSNVGAYQNRLEYTMENLSVSIENYSASESAIRDVDMAAEMTTFTKNQILQQSGIAMLSQANSAPQQILSLLNG